MQSAYHPLTEGKDRYRPDKSFFCWSHTNTDGLRVLFWPSSMFTMPFITETSCVYTQCVTNSYMHVRWSPRTCKHTHTNTVIPSTSRGWCILTLEPHLPTLEISKLRLKPSLCPLINSQKSPWPGFYTWKPSPLYHAQTKKQPIWQTSAPKCICNYFLHLHSMSIHLKLESFITLLMTK